MHTIELLINLGIALATNAHAASLLIKELTIFFKEIKKKRKKNG